MLAILLIVLGVVLVAAGLAGTVLPLLPGTPLVLAGLVLIAWAEHFTYVGTMWIVVLTVMTVLTFVVDYLAGMLGAGRVGATRLGLLGATVGTFVGLLFFPLGLLLGPFLGAIAGELLARSDLLQAGRVGTGAVVGTLLGAIGNLLITLAMVVLFVIVRFT